MRFSIARGELLDSLSIVGKGLSSRTTLPILSGILASARSGVIVLTSTDLEVSVRDETAANVDKEGDAVLPGRLLTDIVRSLPEAAVTIDVQGDKASIQCGQASFVVRTLAAEDYPKFPEVETSQSAVVRTDVLASVVRQVSRAVSRDETRPILTGVYTVIESGFLRMVATDSYRLAVREVPLEGTDQELEVVVPGKVIDDLPKMAEGAEEVSLGVSDNQILFEFGDTTLVSRRIEGAFPNYKQLIPKETATRATVDREELVAAAKRVSLLAQHNTPIRVGIAVQDGTVTLSAMTQEVGEATESLMAECEGEDVEIAFNHAFLSDGISASASEKVSLDIVSPLKPGVLTSPGEDGFVYLLMPVRLG